MSPRRVNVHHVANTDNRYVVIVKKVINIYENSHSQTAMESVWSVSKLSTESIGRHRELFANCVHTADATKQFRRVGVGGVYWALSWRPVYVIKST